MITKESIEERKEVLLKDIQSVKLRLTEYEQKKMEDTALVNALTGALQQCDLFVAEIKAIEKETTYNDVKIDDVANEEGESDGGQN